MDNKISLYNLSYFEQGNTMMGSCTPQELGGVLLAKIFNYRVSYVKKKNEEGEQAYIEALYFVDNKCFDLTEKENVVTKTFDPSDEGIEAASKWLLEEYNKYARTV